MDRPENCRSTEEHFVGRLDRSQSHFRLEAGVCFRRGRFVDSRRCVDGPSAAFAVMLHQNVRIVSNRPHLALAPKPLPERQCGRCERLRRLLPGAARLGEMCVRMTMKRAFPGLGVAMSPAWMHGSRRVEESALPKSVESSYLSVNKAVIRGMSD
jgi:hypothetical protein